VDDDRIDGAAHVLLHGQRHGQNKSNAPLKYLAAGSRESVLLVKTQSAAMGAHRFCMARQKRNAARYSRSGEKHRWATWTARSPQHHGA